MTKITVIGAGFAALTAVRKLRAADRELHIDLIAPRPEFIYYPSTIWIPTGLRQPEEVVIDLQRFLQRMQVHYHPGSAIGLENAGRTVVTDHGTVDNDGLIIASGGRFLKKLPGIEHAITPCEGVRAAVQIRDRLAEMRGGTLAFGFAGNPREPAAMRGGPIFEFLFGIDQFLRRRGDRDAFKLVFFTPAAQPGNRLGPKAVAGLMREMAKRNIATHLGHPLQAFTASQVITEGGTIAADLIVFMPGMTGNEWFDRTTLPRSPGGLLQANEHCQVVDQDRVYVAGDSGSFPGPDWLPKQAHMADLQAEAAVANLLGELRGQSPRHGFKAELICIVDTRTSGILVRRTEKRGLVLPATPLFHWAKRAFEWWYLRQYR